MNISAAELCEMVGGELKGDGKAVVSQFAPIEEAVKGALTFIANPKYIHYLYTTQASVVLVNKGFTPEKPYNSTLIYVEDVYSTLSSLLKKFNGSTVSKTGVEKGAYVDESVEIGDQNYIGANAYIGKNCVLGKNTKIFPNSYLGDNVKVGDNTILYAGVKIYDNCVIGSDCIIHAGCVIGSDGFGFAPQKNGTYEKMPQTGNVVIEDSVEIGANTTIDRATMKSTIIRKGAKLDNLIQIAHNVEIGENTAIAAQTGISGSAKIGKNCIIGGQVGIVGHISIADGTQIGAQSGVSNDIKTKNEKWFGSPVIPIKEALKSNVLFKKLPELYNRLLKIENFIAHQQKDTHEGEVK